MVQRRRARLIIRGKWVNEKVTQGGLLEGKDWLKESFGTMFDSEQCEIIFMGRNGPRTGMTYIFHSSLSSAVWRPDMGLKAGARMKSISETWVVEEAQELVLAKSFWEPGSGQEDQLQSWHLQNRIRTQMKAEPKMFILELKRHPGYCLKWHLNIQFALLATGPMMQGRGRLSG